MSNKEDKNPEIFNNSLSGLVGGLQQQFGMAQVSQTDTMYLNLRYNLISNDRALLSNLYVENGIIQTLIDQPVDDGFRLGFEMKIGELSPDEIEQLQAYLEKNGVIKAIIQANKWARLFGGGAVLVITDQDPATPLNLDQINKDSPMEFAAVDLWELNVQNTNIQASAVSGEEVLATNPEFYHYYGRRVHKSRVYRINGKEAPAFVRRRLRGWGMSEIEKVIRSMNQYLKNQNVTFELLDEAKVDVYKIDGFNAALMTSGGTDKVTKRIQSANQVKNFLNAIVMDTKDEYDQKKMNFSGLSEVMTQIREQIAGDLKMPVTKLFGTSSAGFNSGEDDIENYNAMIESEVRSKVKYNLVDLIGLSCQKLFDFVPDEITITFPSLRILNAKEEEDVKNAQYNRITSAYQSGAIDRQTWAEAINKNSLLPIEVDEAAEALEPLDGQFIVSASDNVDGGN